MTSREDEKRKHYTYNKSFLESLDKLIGYVETSREDLLSAMHTLFDAYRSEFEQNQLLQADVMRLKQENVSLESARNQVQADLLQLRDQYQTERVRNQELAQRVNVADMVFKASQATVEVTNTMKPESNAIDEKSSLGLVTSAKLEKVSSLHTDKRTENFTQRESKVGVSLTRDTSTHRSSATTTMVTPQQVVIHQVTPKRSSGFKNKQHQHQFEAVKNRLRFNKCVLCKTSILPLSQYYQCIGCQLVIDWGCFAKNVTSPCANNLNRFKLSQLITSGDVPAILLQCYELIEMKGGESQDLYQETGDENGQETNRVISKYLATPSTAAASSRLNKLNVKSLCAIVLKVLNQLDEPLITRRLWADFVRASDQQCPDERYELMQILVQQLPRTSRLTLAHLVLHLKNLLNKNYCNNLNKQSMSQIFGPVVVKTNSKMAQADKQDRVRLANLQQKIVQTLLNLSRDFWQSLLHKQDSPRDESHLSMMMRRKTISYSKILQAEKHRVSFHEKISNSLY